ncbi:FAD-dependent oxidoreductase [Nocardioides sp. CER19]|uniref:NAD(P)/FAD-dependent oxidoreductase n=1 Tax=Nocardioides sp. CER19 TaxID=3038538 RepID=UPI002449D59A|nr:FAD-dependent oxidoreductase [Nocardioides sp. CER19]MDH2416172.1 FAD-dependent oxidoreductase [Nocardioides sp. CER19]
MGTDSKHSVETWARAALSHTMLAPLWLSNPDRPEARPALSGRHKTDLLIVGGGFTGLWAAVRAAERFPNRKILLIEGDRIAEHATGRNGGFCEASLTHGESNGRARWPDEYETLHRLGLENLYQIEETIARYGIDCGFLRGATMAVATHPHQVEALGPGTAGFLDAEQARAKVNSPTYLAGHFSDGDCALVDPARLAWGLAGAAESLGVEIAEHTRLVNVRTSRRGTGVDARTQQATVNARHVVLATNATPALRRLKHSIVPVYDYVLATEPLSDRQLAELRWDPRLGVSDAGNQFHYYRITPDRRILWGGYDAIYHYGRGIDADYEDRTETFETLAKNFARTFPQLRDVRFTHRWAGVIDTSTRFCAFFGTAHRGQTAYALGFTGLGVGASRFAADVMLDLLERRPTKRTQLAMVHQRAVPFPPEPFAWVGIQATRHYLAREDRTGKRGIWLRTLDRLGLGFDS